MVGATAFMETLELAVELRRGGYGQGDDPRRLGFDLYPYTEDAVAAVERSVLQWRFIDGVAARIDAAALRDAQSRKDAVRAYEVVYAALGARVGRGPADAASIRSSSRSRPLTTRLGETVAQPETLVGTATRPAPPPAPPPTPGIGSPETRGNGDRR